MKRPNKDITEIFGYAPDDTTLNSRSLWKIGACPFIGKPCTKSNHDSSVIYGTCSVTTPYGDCVICPNRLYFNKYEVLQRVAVDAFGTNVPFYTYEEFVANRANPQTCVVALGMYSGKEVRIGKSLSMDWVLAKIENGNLLEYLGIEVQSIDITGNYRDCWYAYKNIESVESIPSSEHGMNWANVHKRLIPQIIRKSTIFSKSKYVSAGLYFILPDIVYRKFEDIIGVDIPLVYTKSPDTITVHTYKLGSPVPMGQIRSVIIERKLQFLIEEFSSRFMSGSDLIDANLLDTSIKKILGVN